MFGRIWHLVLKELIQLWRDRLFAPLIILGPVLELSLVAWATSAPITNLPTAVVDMDRSAESRQLVLALQNTDTFAFTHYLDDQELVAPLIESDEVVAAVLIPHDFSQNLLSPISAPTEVGLILDGADPMAARAALQAAEGVVNQLNQQVVTQWYGGRDADVSLVQPQVRIRFNEELRKSTFTLPAELGMILFAIALIVASLGIAREKEQGTLEQLLVTPMRPTELILSKALPPLLLSFTAFTLMLLLSIYGFHVPMRGSWSLLLSTSMFFLLIELGIGLAASAYASNQMQASMLVFGWVMIEFFFTGYGVPVENMPLLMQRLANIFPMYHFMAIFRSILLKGAGIPAFWEHLVIAFFLGIVFNTLTLVLLRRQRWA